jgi:hypothetical protein
MKNYPWLLASVCKSCPFEKTHTIWWWSPFIPVVQPHLSSMTLPNLRGLNIFSFRLSFSKLWSILGYERKMKWFYRWLVEILIFNHIYIFIAKKNTNTLPIKGFPSSAARDGTWIWKSHVFFLYRYVDLLQGGEKNTVNQLICINLIKHNLLIWNTSI